MNSITFKEVTLEDEKLVQSIIEQTPRYFLNVEGVLPASDTARRELCLLPAGCSADQKHSYLIYEGSDPIGFADLYAHFRISGTAVLSLLLLIEKRQGSGLGKYIYQDLENLIKYNLGCNVIRIGVIDSNPVQEFWKKMGFSLTGETKPHHSDHFKRMMIVMEKTLEDESFLESL